MRGGADPSGVLALLRAAGVEVDDDPYVSPRGEVMVYCPFHGERKGKSRPGLALNVHSGLWKCFACDQRGRLPLLLSRQGIYSESEARAAVDELALAPAPERREGPADLVPELPAPILSTFVDGVPELEAAGFSADLLRDEEVVTDKLLRRTAYLLRDSVGRLVGIMGRLPADQAGARGRYKVYQQEIAARLRGTGIRLPPGCLEFKNHAHVWRAHRVLAERPSPIIVAEGFKAALWWVQHGWRGAVALMGSSATPEQQQILLRLSMLHSRTPAPMYLALDNDPAGVGGTDKLLNALPQIPFRRVCYPPVVKQVDDVRISARETLAEMLNNATPW